MGTGDPQEVDSKDDESQIMVDNVVEETDITTVQELQISELLDTENSRFHNLEELVSQCTQETDKPDISHSTTQQEIENTEFLCSLNDNVQTNVDNDTLLDISPQETQVFATNRSNVKDNLLTVDNTEPDTKVLCAPQEEQAGSSSVQPGSSVDNNLPVTEKLSSPPIVALCKQQDSPSPQKLSCPKELSSPQNSPSPQNSSSPQKLPSSDKLLSPNIINIMSLTPREIDTLLSARKTVPRVQLVNYDYDADSDSDNDDVAMESNDLGGVTKKIKNLVVDYRSTDDSTDTISDDSDSNSLVHKECNAEFTSAEYSYYLGHDLSDTGTVSSDEKTELCTDVKNSLETTVLLSPPLPYMKIAAQKSNLTPISLEADMPPSIMDVNTSAEEKAQVHTVETSQSVSTIPTMTTPPVSVEVSPSISAPLVFALTGSPIFDKTTQPVVDPVTSMDTTVSGNLSLVTDSVSCNESSSTSLIPTTTCQTFEDTFVSNKDTPVTSEQSPVHTADGSEFVGDVHPLVNYATDIKHPSLVQNPVNYSAPPVSTACNELPVFAVPDSVPNTCSSSIPTSNPIQSTSIPYPSFQVCNSSVNESLAVTMTQASSQTSIVEISHVPNDNTNDVPSTVSSNESNDRVTDSTPSFDSCPIEKSVGPVSDPDDTITTDTVIRDGDGRPDNAFPAALKLSIDLSVLPQKKKVLQRAKWASLLTTPVPVLRKRKMLLKSTVTVKSTVIKSDRKPNTQSSSSPKKQPQEPDGANQHGIGQVLWCKFSYWDPWPCKIIVHSDVDQPEPPSDQVNK